MAVCFCGCGNEVVSGPRGAMANTLADTMDRDLVVFRDALDDPAFAGQSAELADLIARGTVLRDQLRGYLHGHIERKQLDKKGRGQWLKDSAPHRKRIMTDLASSASGGGLRLARLLHGRGVRVTAEVTSAQDTGRRANAPIIGYTPEGGAIHGSGVDPVVAVELGYQTEDGVPVEARGTVTVPPDRVPGAGDRVVVIYEPDEPESFILLHRDPGS